MKPHCAPCNQRCQQGRLCPNRQPRADADLKSIVARLFGAPKREAPPRDRPSA